MARKRKSLEQIHNEDMYKNRPSRTSKPLKLSGNMISVPLKQDHAADDGELDYVGVGCEECGMLNKWREKSPPLTHCVCCRSMLPEHIDSAE